MSEQTAVTVQEKEDAPVEWGTRGEVGALADRFAAMLPKANELTRAEVLTAAQYCRVMDLNPFRGEVYFYKSRGQMVVVDGYKALARWAGKKAPYSEWDENLPLDDGRVEHVRVWILRDDRREMLEMFTGMGAPWAEAIKMAATYADGVVTQADTLTRNNAPKDPPTGWTWRDVARKRAFKNAINLSHGAPSPRDIADMSWDVNGTKTLPEDWDGAEDLSQHEAEKLAALRANGREQQAVWQTLEPQEKQQRFEENNRLLHGDPDFEGFDTPPESPPGPDYESVPDQDAEPAPTPQATAKRANNQAAIKTGKWVGASVALAEAVPYYQDRHGAPDGWHMAGAAKKLGHSEITDDNLDEVIDALTDYAKAQMGLTDEQPQAELPLEGVA